VKEGAKTDHFVCVIVFLTQNFTGPLNNLSDTQLDFYACLNELDHAVGRVLDAMDANGYGKNTLTWLVRETHALCCFSQVFPCLFCALPDRATTP
jgi:hypothetical protein